MAPRRILLKITGELFLNKETGELDKSHLVSLAHQIAGLSKKIQCALVVGGGNFFRGDKDGQRLGISPAYRHQIGMLATAMNGLIIADIFGKEGLDPYIISAFECPIVGEAATEQHIEAALKDNKTLIFVGGTGNPFFTTDTAAIIRGLQIGATQVWKGTNVAGVFDEDPRINPHAQYLPKLTHTYAMNHNIGIMDSTAFALAKRYDMPIRIFNIFEQYALVSAEESNDYGSSILPEKDLQ